MRLAALLLLTGCAGPAMIGEPYPVEVVREVVRPVDRTYTDPLPTPELPEGAIENRDLADLIQQWRAWGRVVLDHRAKVAELTKEDHE